MDRMTFFPLCWFPTTSESNVKLHVTPPRPKPTTARKAISVSMF